MPPARKDPTEADDACRPSTSRAFSPSLVPPVKRARTTPGVPSISSTRRQSIGNGGRQARMEEFIDEEHPSSPTVPLLSDTVPLPSTTVPLPTTTVSPSTLSLSRPSRARSNWLRLGSRLLSAKTAPTPTFTLGLFEMEKKSGFVYTIWRDAFKIESDLEELCRSVEDRVKEGERVGGDETGRVRAWPGGEALAYWILEGVIGVRGKRVMEMGCGSMGLPARAANWKGAKRVTATDGNEECIESMKKRCEDGVRVERMEWAKREVEEGEKAEVIIAADAVFFEKSHGVLMETVESWMREGGEAWFAAPERRGSLRRWKERVEEEGRWKMDEWREADEILRREVKKEVDEDEDWPRLIRITRRDM